MGIVDTMHTLMDGWMEPSLSLSLSHTHTHTHTQAIETKEGKAIQSVRTKSVRGSS